ncbi:extracellular superoxide dismutase [Gadus macrocephalus]|uniref:extracellular superoxide dismutase n=1 Tax=Gadus macrocephalus TaxID=80720 RepID=UPI0028CB862F|nr:extracellular superoxide dismutase [Gadus macrocephalus]
MFQTRSKWPALCISLLVFLAEARGQEDCEDPGVPPEVVQFNNTLYATCRMKPSSGLAADLDRLYGHVLFKQEYPDGTLNVHFIIGGFPMGPSNLRAIHVHQFGDISGGCTSTGPHYNPDAVSHPGHPGDFGNFAVKDGKIIEFKEYAKATLFGPQSVLGRGVVLHLKADDMGNGGNAESLLNGNAGTRLACCVIGLSSDALWNKCL